MVVRGWIQARRRVLGELVNARDKEAPTTEIADNYQRIIERRRTSLRSLLYDRWALALFLIEPGAGHCGDGQLDQTPHCAYHQNAGGEEAYWRLPDRCV